jgi:hypothetical protein
MTESRVPVLANPRDANEVTVAFAGPIAKV